MILALLLAGWASYREAHPERGLAHVTVLEEAHRVLGKVGSTTSEGARTFLDALADHQPVYSTDPSEAELAQLLAGWRDEIRTPPLMSPVTPRDAVAALTRAVEARKRTRTSMALVGSIAAAVLCIGGFGAVVASSGPGDPLYGLHTMLLGEQPQTRTDQVMLASQQLAEVQQLIDEGQWDAAQSKLQAVTTTVATVNVVEQKQQLVTQWQDLTVKVDARDPNATLPPGEPPPPMPEPVVVAPGSATPTTTSPQTNSPPSGFVHCTSSGNVSAIVWSMRSRFWR